MTTVIKSKNREYHFYDTSALLEKSDLLFKDEENIVICTTVLSELENIKTSKFKDEDVKNAARHVLHSLANHQNNYDVVIFNPTMLKPIKKMGLIQKNEEPNNDLKILSAALWYDHNEHPDETYFYTNDLSLQNIANLFFGEDSIRSVTKKDIDVYTGYKIKQMTEEELADLYSHQTINFFDQLPNEYLIIKDTNNCYLDTLCWTGEEYRPLKYKVLESKLFGKIKPMPKDPFQACAIDSMLNNQITLIKGAAGTGKSYLALGFLFHLLEKGKIDKIIIFCNTIATKNSARLGFYPGSKDEKLLDSQIGNFLVSKIGDKYMVDRLIQEGKIILLPMSDIRGYDTSGMNAGVYITEAQNMDISLMKLALQRIGEDSYVVIDGDCATQVDDIAFAGTNNGMKRASNIFRGETLYGEVELSIIHRSKIGAIAEKM